MYQSRVCMVEDLSGARQKWVPYAGYVTIVPLELPTPKHTGIELTAASSALARTSFVTLSWRLLHVARPASSQFACTLLDDVRRTCEDVHTYKLAN